MKNSANMDTVPGLKINFYGNIEPKIIPVSAFPIIVEDVCEIAARHLSQKLSSSFSESETSVRSGNSDDFKEESLLTSFFLSTFGLVNKEHRLWLSPREKLTCNSTGLNYHEQYFFRIRFRICESNLDLMERLDSHMLNYFYYQCKDDFLNDRLPELYGKKLELEKQLGLVVLELMILEKSKENSKSHITGRPQTKENPESQTARQSLSKDQGTIQTDGLVCYSSVMRNVKFFNLWKHLSKSMRRKYRAPWYYIRIYISLRSEVQSFFQKREKIDVNKLKKLYVRGVLEYVPNYATERYMARFVKDDGTSIKLEEFLVDAYESLPRGISSVVRPTMQFNLLLNISLTTSGQDNNGGQVHIHQFDGTPKMLLFEKKEEAESFVSGVDGFYRHMQDFYNGLCKTVEPPSLELLRTLRSFGPKTHEQASDKLQMELTADENVHSQSKSTLFLIYQSATDMHTFFVLSGCKGDKPEQFKRRPISHKMPGRFVLESAEGVCTEYDSTEELLKHLRADSKHIRPQMGTDSGICELFTDDVISHYYPAGSRQVDKKLREPVCFTDQHICPDDVKYLGCGRYTEVSRACLDLKKSCSEQDVVIKQLKRDSLQYMEGFQAGTSKLLEMKHGLFIGFLGIMVTPPYRVVLEMAPGGNLERLLKQTEHPLSLMQVMLVADQVSQGIHWLNDMSLTHGNLRSRNILVFKVIKSDILIKIGDPGLVSYFNKMPLTHDYNQERLPWIAVELYSNLQKQTMASDIYAFAMLWWELVSQGQRPLEEIKPKSTQKLQDLIAAGTRPRCPKGLALKVPDGSGTMSHNVTQTEGAAKAESGLSRNMNQSSANPSHRKLTDELQDSSGISMGDNFDKTLENIKCQIWNFIQKCWISDVTDRPSIQEIGRFVLSMCDEVRQLDEEENTDWDTVVQQNALPDDLHRLQRPPHPEGSSQCIDINRLKPVENGFVGKGFYGEVRKYKLYEMAQSDDTTEGSFKFVAVKKMLKMDLKTKIQFLKEIDVLKKLEHSNIVKLEGICSQPDVLLVMEFVENGSLKDFVKSRPRLSNARIGKFCLDVAKGIEYLHSKEVVHRDLAARNILITQDLTAKITDFGLAVILREGKDYTRGNKDQPWPLYSCAPEALSYGKFTKKGDVWSFGVLMWEAYTHGDKPIPAGDKPILASEKLLLNILEQNKRLAQKNIPTVAYDIMMLCWTFEPDKRPDINSVIDKIDHMLAQ